MTDLEKLEKLFKEFGIEHTKNDEEDGCSLVLSEGDEKVDGYIHFGASFDFDEKGNFIKVFIYE
jgi:hypothetical protein